MKLIIFIALIVFVFWYKPFDSCRDYSEFNCKQIQEAKYNVWFYFNKNSDAYNIGSADGLSQCGNIAKNYAYNKGLTYDWSYVCCMKAKGSDCYEKHR